MKAQYAQHGLILRYLELLAHIRQSDRVYATIPSLAHVQ